MLKDIVVLNEKETRGGFGEYTAAHRQPAGFRVKASCQGEREVRHGTQRRVVLVREGAGRHPNEDASFECDDAKRHWFTRRKFVLKHSAFERRSHVYSLQKKRQQMTT